MKTQAVTAGRIYDGFVPVQIPGPGFESRTGQFFTSLRMEVTHCLLLRACARRKSRHKKRKMQDILDFFLQNFVFGRKVKNICDLCVCTYHDIQTVDCYLTSQKA